jgi:hypothetical protein
MPLSDRTRGVLTGIVMSAGIAVVAKVFGKPLVAAARPLTKAGIRSLIDAREKGEAWLAEAGENLSDIIAEVRSEREAERSAPVAVSHDGPRVRRKSAQPSAGGV